jgi:aminoglycoside phosphotransferase (APT) family kinase protein
MDNAQDIRTLSDELISYLRAELGNPALDHATPMVRLKGGYETATYRIQLGYAPEDLSRPLVLRLYPQFYGTRNAIWESMVQNELAGAGYPVARVHMVCTDMCILGGAFIIMDHMSGKLLAAAPRESVPELLGKTHAELHKIDPDPLIEILVERGISEYDYGLSRRFDWLHDKAGKLSWLRQAVNWLLEYQPPEPERLSVCHGDFHPFNLLYADGEVTGVLDWPGFAITDPVFDVANSIVLITIASKHLASSMGDLSTVDWDLMADRYLAAYRAHRPFDDTYLDYYRVRRCVLALAQGVEGQKVWQHPLIVRDLHAYIYEITGVQMTSLNTTFRV